MNKITGVMGCGWLGLPLAKVLLKKGHTVRGSTTSKSKIATLEESGINPFLIQLGEETIDGDITPFLKGMDTLVINVPPGLRAGNSNYVLKMKQLHKEVRSADVSKILFVSSTSVYGSNTGKVTESTTPIPSSESGRQLLEAENIFRHDKELKSTIVRFGGLIGPGRHPAVHLSGRSDLKNGSHPVNLIHLEDCISLITSILEEGWWDPIFNGVYPEHPAKQRYYAIEAEKMGLEAPQYKKVFHAAEGKTVDSDNLDAQGFVFSKGIWSQ